MCSINEALPFVALAVFSASDWEQLLRGRIDSLLPGKPSQNTTNENDNP